MKRKIIASTLLALACSAACAAGAPWYKWRNPADGSIVCSQFTPGEGWVPVQGPFQESQCRKPGNPQ